jgi:hypothetical protein
VTSSKRYREIAREKLTHVGGHIQEVDLEIYALTQELEILTVAKEDAKWAGDATRVGRIGYRIIIKNTMRKMLQRRRNKLLKEMTE